MGIRRMKLPSMASSTNWPAMDQYINKLPITSTALEAKTKLNSRSSLTIRLTAAQELTRILERTRRRKQRSSERPELRLKVKEVDFRGMLLTSGAWKPLQKELGLLIFLKPCLRMRVLSRTPT